MFEFIKKIINGRSEKKPTGPARPPKQPVDINSLSPSALQRYLVNESGVNKAFTSSSPILHADALFGRASLIKEAETHILEEGNHVVLFGNRGSGKSSVGRVLAQQFQSAAKELKEESEEFIEFRCNPDSTLKDICTDILALKNIDVKIRYSADVSETTFEKSVEANASIMGIGAKGRLLGEDSVGHGIEKEGFSALAHDPSWIAAQIFDIKGVFFIDEVDVIADKKVRHSIAHLMKCISDKNSRLNVIIAGIAQNAAELTDSHPSIQRNVKEIEVERLNDPDLIKILERGEELVKVYCNGTWKELEFETSVKASIARFSHGYPYFTQLLGKYCVYEALDRGEYLVGEDILSIAKSKAIKGAEDELQRALDSALRNDNEGLKARILYSAAETSADFISAKQLSNAMKDRFDDDFSPTAIGNYIKSFVRNVEDLPEIKLAVGQPKPIFIRNASGQYSFYDPRMPSFIRLCIVPTGGSGSDKVAYIT